MRHKLFSGAVAALTIAGTIAATTSPAAAWCRWGGCGWGWNGPGPVVAGVIAGTAIAAATVPRPYSYAYRSGGYLTCPPGYHFGPQGRACWSNR